METKDFNKKIKEWTKHPPSRITKEYFIGEVSMFLFLEELTQEELDKIWCIFFEHLEIFKSRRVYVGRIVERITHSFWDEEFRMRVDILNFLIEKYNIKRDNSLSKWFN